MNVEKEIGKCVIMMFFIYKNRDHVHLKTYNSVHSYINFLFTFMMIIRRIKLQLFKKY